MKQRTLTLATAACLVMVLVAPLAPAYASGHPSPDAGVRPASTWASSLEQTIGFGLRWLFGLWDATRYTGDPDGSATTSSSSSTPTQSTLTNQVEAACDPTTPPEMRYTCDPDG